ncbi:hypothetical protein ACSBOB_25980 [Mesorhizobium sp. ASY16-5R]|uniref:hypothetical protein n=1 Tax=Mesorhizobium sp. ASY16-5R TaxID=3445772 RepID=UPI003FA0F87D
MTGGVLGIPLKGETVGMDERKRRAEIIRRTTLEVLERGAQEDIPPHFAADRMAREIIASHRQRRR